MQDWKEALSSIKMSSKKAKKLDKPNLDLQSKRNPLSELVRTYMKVHPSNALLTLSNHFNTITHRNTGGWPEEDSPELSPQEVFENIGDLIKVASYKNKVFYMRTNKGYFKFFNK